MKTHEAVEDAAEVTLDATTVDATTLDATLLATLDTTALVATLVAVVAFTEVAGTLATDEIGMVTVCVPWEVTGIEDTTLLTTTEEAGVVAGTDDLALLTVTETTGVLVAVAVRVTWEVLVVVGWTAEVVSSTGQ